MDKLQIKKLLLLSRRSYAVATENRSMQSVLSVTGKAEDLAEEKVKEKSFWMRDPKTGNWIPESHFGEIDAADLRDKFLNGKPKL
ncbi:protein SENESCENCE-ASSOCIATED GENE 21, mitochondrial isoform X2 [Jatropha curcas]|uniref:protein SENESCENCE-ASSOCIATED GENE 21, mitochondrial isoform X2 n=1 Tax=Jatropha curcas TaxID=180498 RepID=UPI0009D652AD|nr:protein SENESCENCE-ASSOCIATED GENE 21, mitochondrial isoform X2 [Jatropha curcas]